jgi:hypothetical protein
MQSGAHAFTRLNAVANIGQVFHYQPRGANGYSLSDDLLGYLVIHVGHVAAFSPRDLAKKLFSRFAAIGLKPATKRQEDISLMAKLATIDHFSGAEGRDVVLAQVHADNRAAFNGLGVIEVQDEIKGNCSGSHEKYCFSGC